MSNSILIALTAALCAQAVVASPVHTSSTKTSSHAPAAPTCVAVQRNAAFDDLTGIPGTVLNNIPIPYMDMYYQGATFAQTVETNLAPGVVPHSGTKYVHTCNNADAFALQHLIDFRT
jgi:hypothetical protein